ncbi:MAG: cupin domain-containing protein [Alphaproteobacteria bacterium]
MTVPSVDWSRVPWQAIRPGIERKAFTAGGCTLALNRLSPGFAPGPHSHPHAQTVYIIAGTLDLRVGTEIHRLGPGSVLYVPPHVEHGAVAVIGDEPCLNLDVFVPARPEYAAPLA